MSNRTDTIPPVKVTVADGVADLCFDRSRRLNALDAEMAVCFRDAVAQVTADDQVRVVILSGAGRAFMAGGDLTALREGRSEAARAILMPMNDALITLGEARQIVIASLKGPVAGAGMSLALSADLAIAAADTTLLMAYIRIGASPDCGATWALPRLVGLRRAMEIALLSDELDARTAANMGLVNRVVDNADLAEQTGKLAHRIATGPGRALATTKALLRQSFEAGHAWQLADEADRFAICADTDDFAEGIDAFLERRAPRFVGDIKE